MTMDSEQPRDLLERIEVIESQNQSLARETRCLRRILIAFGISFLAFISLGATMLANFEIVTTEKLVVQHPQGGGSRVEINAAPNGEGIYFYDDNNRQRIKLESGQFGTLLSIDGKTFP
jgi:hypothetical protein